MQKNEIFKIDMSILDVRNLADTLANVLEKEGQAGVIEWCENELIPGRPILFEITSADKPYSKEGILYDRLVRSSDGDQIYLKREKENNREISTPFKSVSLTPPVFDASVMITLWRNKEKG